MDVDADDKVTKEEVSLCAQKEGASEALKFFTSFKKAPHVCMTYMYNISTS